MTDTCDMVQSSRERLCEELKERVVAELGELKSSAGTLIYSPLKTLTPGNLYLIGFNPGGSKERHGEDVSILAELQRRICEPTADTCAYCPTDQAEYNSRFNVGTRKIVDALGCGIEDVFATNAIFLRSPNVSSLPAECGPLNFAQVWQRCWRLHEWFLSLVKPRLVVCLGNGEKLSSYALMRSRCTALSQEFPPSVVAMLSAARAKLFRGTLQLAGTSQAVYVLGLHHPSRGYAPNEEAIRGLGDWILRRGD